MAVNGTSNGTRKGQLVALLAAGTSKTEAAKACGLGARTVFRYLREPDFCEEIERVRTELVEQAVARLSAAATKAVDKLVELLERSPSEHIQLSAAKALLDHLPKRSQVELAAHMEHIGSAEVRCPASREVIAAGLVELEQLGLLGDKRMFRQLSAESELENEASDEQPTQHLPPPGSKETRGSGL